jgi:arginase
MSRTQRTPVTCTLGLPIDSVGRTEGMPSPFGTEKMPAALRAAGLVDGLGVPDHGDLDLHLVGSTRDPDSGLVAWPSLDPVTRQIREAVRSLLADDQRPLLLGGCCALVPGAVAGLRDAVGAAALVNVDGHLDLYDATTSPTGEAADVPVSALLDLGVPAWNASIEPSPVLRPEHVALVGHRDTEEARSFGSTMPEDVGIGGSWDVASVKQDAPAVAAAVVGHLGPTPYWLHLDLDVLDQSVLPATDYLMPGGLNWPELTSLLGPLVRADGFAGMSVACLNPDKDLDGRCARETSEGLLAVLR